MSTKKIVVVGAGAWGGWSALMLQKAGYEVTLIDKYGPGNALSGSGGNTRIIRMAYGGSETYINMVARAFELWEEYCTAWKEDMLHAQKALWLFRDIPTGFATLSQPLMKAKGYELEEIDLEKVGQDYPQINLDDLTSAFWEPKAGYLEAARACEVVTEKFIAAGGIYIQDEVTNVIGSGKVDHLETKNGNRLEADQYVFAAGPWMKNFFPKLESLIRVSRQEVYYFESPSDYDRDNLPIWLEFREGDHMFYGIPDHFNQGFKLAYDQRDWLLNPDSDHRDISPEILQRMHEIVVNRFPALAGAKVVKHHTCVYESTSDGDYIMDQAPGFANAIILCGSSGHGFKMGPAIGEMVLAYVQKNKPFPVDLGLNRFENGKVTKSPYQVIEGH